MIFFYSRNMRRQLEAIIQTFSLMVDLLVFFLLLATIYAIVGVRIIPDLSDRPNYDQYWSNFEEFGRAVNTMWIMIFGEGYPRMMLPALAESRYYLLYFLPHMAMSVLVWSSVPVAVFFNGFKNARSRKVILDRLKEKEALFACFVSIHNRM